MNVVSFLSKDPRPWLRLFGRRTHRLNAYVLDEDVLRDRRMFLELTHRDKALWKGWVLDVIPIGFQEQ